MWVLLCVCLCVCAWWRDRAWTCIHECVCVIQQCLCVEEKACVPLPLQGLTQRQNGGPLRNCCQKGSREVCGNQWDDGSGLSCASHLESSPLISGPETLANQFSKYVLCRLTEFVRPNELQNTPLFLTVNGSAAVSASHSSGFVWHSRKPRLCEWTHHLVY